MAPITCPFTRVAAVGGHYASCFQSLIFKKNYLITAPRAPASSFNRSANGGGGSMAQIEELNATIVEKNLAIEGLEKERDFYFGKLRDIEVSCQEFETVDGAAEFSQKVLAVLYATEVSRI